LPLCTMSGMLSPPLLRAVANRHSLS